MKPLIYIMLGNCCNFECTYCMAEKKRPDKSSNMNTLFEKINDILNIGNGAHIRFFGGEPLMYLDEIKTVTKTFGSIPNITFDAPTNGSLIDKGIVNFINGMDNFSLVISHDGPGTLHTRKKDVLEDKKIVSLLSSMDRVSFLSVIHKYSMSIYTCWNHISERLNKEVYSYPVPIYPSSYDFNIELLQINIEVLKTESITMTNRYESGWREKKYLSHVINKYNMAKISGYEDKTCFCNKLHNNFHFDMDGNRMDCCSCGNIVDSSFLSSYELKLKNRTELLSCKNCITWELCRGGCDMVHDRFRKDNCKMMQAIYGPIAIWAKENNMLYQTKRKDE